MSCIRGVLVGFEGLVGLSYQGGVFSAEGGWPGSPGGDSLSFASPKGSKQRKGDPAVCVPSLRYGQPAVLGPDGVKNNSLRSNKFLPLSVWTSAPRRIQKGVETGIPIPNTKQPKTETRIPEETRTRHGESLLVFVFGISVFGSRSRLPRPGWAEERRDKRIRAKTCLSRRRVVFDPAWLEHRRLPEAKRRDPDCGSPFLW
ncbi:hypothetical protein SAMN05216350_101157 [Polaromonas sp. YR568]|nr:hypothetical protein SAMN05216350_101157 [Polaromonas sp. YR568]